MRSFGYILAAEGLRSAQEVWAGLKAVFTDFEWTFVLDAIFFAILFYFVFRTLAESNAKKLIVLFVFLWGLAAASALFSAQLGPLFLYLITAVLVLFFLLLFSTELKRSIWQTHSHSANIASELPSRQPFNKVGATRADENIAGIVKAVTNLSKANIGALIVLSNGNLPKGIIDSGVSLNAAISSQLIEGIFIPKAPLHDGAMVILGDKIQAAGCFLPLTQKDFPNDYGTRHRAGIGVTEVADVATIIVSEETGIVSTVKQGKITRYVDAEQLRHFLRDYYWKDFNAEGRKA